jgi:hypothetical protein
MDERRWAVGGGAAGKRRWAAGPATGAGERRSDGRWASGGRRQAAGGRRQAAGGRRQAAGGRRRAASGGRRAEAGDAEQLRQVSVARRPRGPSTVASREIIHIPVAYGRGSPERADTIRAPADCSRGGGGERRIVGTPDRENADDPGNRAEPIRALARSSWRARSCAGKRCRRVARPRRGASDRIGSAGRRSAVSRHRLRDRQLDPRPLRGVGKHPDAGQRRAGDGLHLLGI